MRTVFRIILLAALIGVHVWLLGHLTSPRVRHEVPQGQENALLNTNSVALGTDLEFENEQDAPVRTDLNLTQDLARPDKETGDSPANDHTSDENESIAAAEDTSANRAFGPGQTAAPPAVVTSVPDEHSYERRFEKMVREYQSRDGTYLPKLLLAYDTPNLHRRALNYFGFRLIARPEHDKQFYFERSAQGAVRKRLGECPYEGWCLEALPGEASYFAALALREGISGDGLQLFYRSLDDRGEAYLRGTELAAIGKAGLKPTDVASVEGQLREASPGRFVLEITKMSRTSR